MPKDQEIVIEIYTCHRRGKYIDDTNYRSVCGCGLWPVVDELEPGYHPICLRIRNARVIYNFIAYITPLVSRGLDSRLEDAASCNLCD